MCGIAGIHRRSDRNVPQLGRLADALLLAIEHRGGDATGLLALDDRGRVSLEKTVTRAPQFVLGRKLIPAKTRTLLLHTRFATKGRADDPRNAHPVTAGTVAAIHNGMIYNDADLFARYGMKRTAAVDSIVIPALVDHLGWDKAPAAFGMLDGGAAVAAVDSTRPGELILARTDRYPMEVLFTEDAIVWASERRAIEQAWRYVYGRAPEGGWLTVADRTMIRVNGKIETVALATPKRSWGKPAPKPTSKATRKRSRKAGQRTAPKGKPAQLALPAVGGLRPISKPATPPPVVTQGDEDGYMEWAVRDLMRWGDCDYAEAYEAVHGKMPTANDPDDDLPVDDAWRWIDDVLTPLDRLEG